MSRVHRMVDWRPDCGPWSMVDHNHGRRPMLARARARQRSLAWDLTVVARRGRERDGDPYPDWHEATEGLGQLGVDGGASSTKRCSRHGGEGRRRAASAVWRGRDKGAFYRGGEGRWLARRWWCAIKRRPVTEEEARGLMPSDEGKERPRDTGLVRPFTRGEGRWMVALGTAATASA
jgi:hypothetical protein